MIICFTLKLKNKGCKKRINVTGGLKFSARVKVSTDGDLILCTVCVELQWSSDQLYSFCLILPGTGFRFHKLPVSRW